MYDIFRRINTGGTPLNAQKIRHCMSRRRSRDFLKELTELPDFGRATGDSLGAQQRMIDREVVLRFCAFWLLGPEGYEPPMDNFLWRVTDLLDDPKSVSEAELGKVRSAFVTGLRNSAEIFQEHAFPKWPAGETRRNPFNRALFESWTVELARVGPVNSAAERRRIRKDARSAMAGDVTYIAAISASTGDRQRVRKRFMLTRGIIEGT